MARPLTPELVAALPAELREGVVAVYLFGSTVSGRAHRESDVDVAVLFDRRRVPERRERFERGVAWSAELVAALGENRIDVVVLDDAPPLFARRILYEGRRVYLADPEAEREFTVAVQLRAPDVERFLARHRTRKLAALAR